MMSYKMAVVVMMMIMTEDSTPLPPKLGNTK
jgi:hypothetical protein